MESEAELTAIGCPIMFYICTEECYNTSMLHNVLPFLGILLLLPQPPLVVFLGSCRSTLLVLDTVI
jgi:hypothetical protein